MLREETVFGPIHSRRLGSSLGINLLPTKGKICNFDCIYCECGWNADGRSDTVLPTAAQVRKALEDKLSALMLDGTRIDSITFSGDGEPTLNPEFPRIIDDTLLLRDAYFPGAKVSVLSNATRVHIDEVFRALRKVDNPIMKIDAPTDELAALINRPAPGYSVRRTVEALKRFEGDFILQTMFLRACGLPDAECSFDTGSPEVLGPWMDIVRELRPRLIQVYSIDRPTPASGLQKYSTEQMKALVEPLLLEGFNIQFR
ncbi:MAG: radical SAM protein [Bacteroidales bacterium]|nr:radical SAM protein [Bacteroidales bacterium]